MSLYTFAPSSTLHQHHPFITWDNAFNEEEIDNIVKYCETLPAQEASIEKENFSDSEIRTSKLSWVSNNGEISWLYDRLAYIARKLNSEFYGFDVFGFVEDLQFTVYDGDENGHYTWHMDMGEGTQAPRKLTLVLQLSDPSEYEGGELQTFTRPNIDSVEKKRGMIAAFPAWTLHRVTPVTKGVRKTLVVWIAGPQFK